MRLASQSWNRCKTATKAFLNALQSAFSLAYADSNDSIPWRKVFLLYLSLIPLLFYVVAPTHGDVELYRRIATSFAQGFLPYKDVTYEYPPYSLLFFIFPMLGRDIWVFQFIFAVQILFFDVIIKAHILSANVSNHLRSISFCAFTVATWFLAYFYFQRLDLIPAVLCFFSLTLLARGRACASGIILSLSIGTKLFPLLLAPLLATQAFRAKRLGPFIGGAVLGIGPLALSSFVWPWWRFAQFHTERGLQVESIYASLIWSLHKLFGQPAEWVWVTAWQEVHGSMADAFLPIAKLAFVITTILGVGASVRVAFKLSALQVSVMCQCSLMALLPFVSFNYVLSPQYMLWLLPFAAIALQQAPKAPALIIVVCCILTPVFYPSPNYSMGLELAETLVLMMRNVLLSAAWVYLVWHHLKLASGRCISLEAVNVPAMAATKSNTG